MLTNKETQTLESIKKILVKKHSECKGRGYKYIDGEIEKCQCMKIFSYIIELVKSKIPQDYWNLSFDDLDIVSNYKKVVQHYIKYLDNAISKGQGLLITGKLRGVGKTSMACEIGKEAIIKRYFVYYNLMQNIVSDKFTDKQEIINKIKNSELVIIDELDKVMMKEGSNLKKQIENFLRDLLHMCKSIILCSNADIDELEKSLNTSSLIKRYMEIVDISNGTDYSEIRNKQLYSNLEKEINYFTDNMIKAAEQFHNNKHLAYEKEYYNLFEEE